MRAYQFINDDYNSDTVKPGFTAEKWYKGKYLLKATARVPDKYDVDTIKGLIITVYDPQVKSLFLSSEGIARARFIVKNNNMEVSMVQVSQNYQRQGIASAMYNFARELGNDIVPSPAQTEMGKAFWRAGAGVGRETPNEPPAPTPLPAKIEIKPQSVLGRLWNIIRPQKELSKSN